ncbi:hypothetical protein BU23DRAFT_632357 [Bimuria novae-zelandiae CBS 107.79]|uniref:Uncharacterized protein n=1 Tax=Bimuria novae-zelandiae CBS 107.79 TaxID=1447943 RepID=A0A6A5VH14_9PLEO|nr:hypothetical protein BU23DRAFT_632357 [Bimuria novae-zelandiae CBS 107.79]
MVELSMGCYHITCRYNHQFYYICQAKWKTCKCVCADQDRVWPGAAVVEPDSDEDDSDDDDSGDEDSDDDDSEEEDAPAPARVRAHLHRHVWQRFDGDHRHDTTCPECDNFFPWLLRCTVCRRRSCRHCTK